jgi:hypothetical protein
VKYTLAIASRRVSISGISNGRGQHQADLQGLSAKDRHPGLQAFQININIDDKDRA